jgi:nucleotide-binding universal stress UspA family protein
MRILFAGDEHPYSAYALKKVAGLAMSTWADVILLGVYSGPPEKDLASGMGEGSMWPSDHPLVEALHRYRDDFISSWGIDESPYATKSLVSEWMPTPGGAWEEVLVYRGSKKDLKIRMRVGSVPAEILAESRRDAVDLIVLGCSKGEQCLWEDPPNVPQKVVNDADCSVLLVKEDQPPKRILACLDHTSVSQESLEMINQMVSIHGAQLELVGLTKEGGAKAEAYTRMIEVGDYYGDRHVDVKTRLAEISDFESFIAKETQQDLLALWMGRKSLLDRFFPRDWVGRFVSTCRSSVLVLR